jgi:acylphosphatase
VGPHLDARGTLCAEEIPDVSEEPVRRRLCIRGRVQGVGFRFATEDAARRIGVAGFVRNRPDGSVEAVFEGPPDRVALAERFCHEGPPLARVASVEVRDEPVEGLSGFGIR